MKKSAVIIVFAICLFLFSVCLILWSQTMKMQEEMIRKKLSKEVVLDNNIVLQMFNLDSLLTNAILNKRYGVFLEEELWKEYKVDLTENIYFSHEKGWDFINITVRVDWDDIILMRNKALRKYGERKQNKEDFTVIGEIK